MGRQSKEESQALWKLELKSAEGLTLTEEHQKLINVVTEMIEDYSLTYEEYLTDISDYLKEAEEDLEPSEVIKRMCYHLIDKYGKEV